MFGTQAKLRLNNLIKSPIIFQILSFPSISELRDLQQSSTIVRNQDDVMFVSKGTGFWSSRVEKYHITIVPNTRKSPPPFSKDHVLLFLLDVNFYA
ncbi:uncharacterized protein LACBIDRAFT_300033 [Laccaria bicolor S238N-H82]|uniref:Predicted protein n=1 Tax=Laccaria bicolor (strain S238N-H82 / ATCC MYA-4686) TaxID=486041 RepID=B0DFW6_LACBS|nr:uncharacterized protein LACBIDRAFT_300033 [Laccaria bicolor S238N-H82]EDR06535.1 predicted protein [Laccaria bicolor S238N-H82]|eukprot:XP_001882907.1 predicted protein [Laccaria bicolor S238N-H82]